LPGKSEKETLKEFLAEIGKVVNTNSMITIFLLCVLGYNAKALF
jgi:hypothetical protein